MKKLIAMLLALVMVFGLVACGQKAPEATPETQPATEAPTEAPTEEATEAPTEAEVEEPADVVVMSHADYIAAELDSEVVIETFVQGHQSWWDNKITVYCQSPDGAYFLYELACSEEDAAKMVPGTKIRVTGYKGEWAGEVEVMDGTFEFVDDGETFIAEPLVVTDVADTAISMFEMIEGAGNNAQLGFGPVEDNGIIAHINENDGELVVSLDLIAHQNELVAFKGMTVKAIEYKNGEPGDDIYLTLERNGVEYSFCVEVYLTGPDTAVYTTVGELVEGDVVDVEGFLYWYEGMNPHITSITKN